MSRINQNNYEAFLLDLVDGTLAPADYTELMQFLAQNPDLDVDLDGIEHATLEDDGIHFPDKGALKKTNASRFDELAIKQLEEGLNAKELVEWEVLLKSDTKFSKEWGIYQKTILTSDKSIVFEGKNALKQEAVVRPLGYYILSAAAALALLIGTYVFFQQNGTTQGIGFAQDINNITFYKGLTNLTQPNVIAIDNASQKENNTIAELPAINSKKKSQPKMVEEVIRTKQQTIALAGIKQSIGFSATGIYTEDAVALALPEPYLEIEPTRKPSFLNALLADARNSIRGTVKDGEMAARLDTISHRGPNLSDLAFFSEKGIQKITGYKPTFRREENDDSSTSAFSIGRYTILTSRSNKDK